MFHRSVIYRAGAGSVTLLAAMLLGGSPVSAAPERPNVILMLADDLGYGDVGVYGATEVQTPNLDQLARQGARLTDGYANAPVCSPSRVALMTGRYQQRFGYHAEDYMGGGCPPLPPGDVLTVGNFMSDAGYRTACYGKWNISGDEDLGANHYGFGHFVGLHHNFNYFTHRRYNHATDDYSGPVNLFENDEVLEKPGYITDLLADYSVAFIEESAASEEPFFLYIPWQAPHAPAQAPSDDPNAPAVNKALPEHRQTYIEIIEHLDKHAGRVIDAVDRLGLEEETLIIFVSDNGGHRASSNAPLRGNKQDLFDGGIRVPYIMRWTGTIPEGTVSEVPATLLDATATALSAAGATVPEEHALDGVDLIPILQNRAPHPDRALYFRRMITNNHQNTTRLRSRAIREGAWKYLDDAVRGNEYLFNLESDISETTDLMSRHPARAAALRQQLEAWEESVTPEQPHFTVLGEETQQGQTAAAAGSEPASSVNGVINSVDAEWVQVSSDAGNVRLKVTPNTPIRRVEDRDPAALQDGWMVQAHGSFAADKSSFQARQIRVNLWGIDSRETQETRAFVQAPVTRDQGNGLFLQWEGKQIPIQWANQPQVIFLDEIKASEMEPGKRILANRTSSDETVPVRGIFYYADRD